MYWEIVGMIVLGSLAVIIVLGGITIVCHIWVRRGLRLEALDDSLDMHGIAIDGLLRRIEKLEQGNET